MSRMKVHLAVSCKSAFGTGTLTTTLCGNMSGKSLDGINSTSDRAAVTCAHCRMILNWPEHWRHRKFISKDTA